MKISALITGYNEQEEIKPLFESLKDFKDIVFIDHASKDDTGKLAKKYGARVFTYPTPSVKVTKDDIEQFNSFFGFPAQFKEGMEVWNSGKEKNDMGEMKCENDWIFLISCDERLTWSYKKVEPLLSKFDQISCRFIHSRKKDGSPDYQFNIVRLYNKKVARWTNGLHEVVIGGRVGFSGDIKIDHYQKPKSYRNEYLPMLEHAALHFGETRTKYYLAREYYYKALYNQAYRMFDFYLAKATWNPEIQQALVFQSDCLWNLNQGQRARDLCMKAIMIDPNQKDPLLQMAKMTFKKDSEVWKRFALQVVNDVRYL